MARGVRLKEARKALRLGLPARERGAKLYGASRQSVHNYENGTNQPNAEYLEGLCTAGASADYLLRGEGPILRGDAVKEVRRFRLVQLVVHGELDHLLPGGEIGEPGAEAIDTDD